jgi:hypothetical protein
VTNQNIESQQKEIEHQHQEIQQLESEDETSKVAGSVRILNPIDASALGHIEGDVCPS